MNAAKLPMLLNGERVLGGGGDEPVVSPYAGVTLARVSLASDTQLDEALDVAQDAAETMRRTPAHVRRDWLGAISQGLAQRRDELAQIIALEVGKPLRAARAEVERAVLTFRIAAEEATRLGGETLPMDAVPAGVGHWGLTRREPRGVVAAITPFNFPLNLLAHKVAPALASGNVVIAKPAPRAPMIGLVLGELAQECGVPPGAFQVLPMDVACAERFISDPRVDMVSFTGSVPVGKRILARAGLKRVTLELGGNAPNLVGASAPLGVVVPQLVAGGFTYAGQVCISVQRIYAHRSVFEPLTEALVRAAEALVLGDPLDERTDVGPMISEREAERAVAWVEEARAAGARVAMGGTRQGAMMSPTVLVEPPEALRCVAEEAFAPLVTLHAFDTFSEAVARANRSRFGLNAAVFTADLGEALYAMDHLRAGAVLVNQSSSFRVDHMPYGGVKDSGLGREGVRAAMEEMTEVKMMVLRPLA